jgi:hypothetical protein
MEHREIRFTILQTLYEYYYNGGLCKYLSTEKAIKQSELDGVDKNDIDGDIVYLKKKGVIESLTDINVAVPSQIMINEKGIDVVEDIVSNSMAKLALENEQTRKEMIEIFNNQHPTDKVRKFFGYVKSHPELTLQVVLQVVSWYLGSGHAPAPPFHKV